MGGDATTRLRLIETAERLFAERGIDGVSLREIATAAGQRNNSAAQYHFGNREGLIDAVFETRMGPIDARRQEMLAAAGAAGRLGDLRTVVEAYALPLIFGLDEYPGATFYARFLAQALYHPGLASLFRHRYLVTEGLRSVIGQLEVALAPLPAAVRSERIALAGSLLVHSVADRERVLHSPPPPIAVSPRRARPVSTELFAANLVDALVGLLRAPVSARARAAAGEPSGHPRPCTDAKGA